MTFLSRRVGIAVFLAFAFAYFFSALIRAITAPLSPTLTPEFGLNARDLGLLAGGYFLGFAATQLPLGTLLDRYGPKRVILWFFVGGGAGLPGVFNGHQFCQPAGGARAVRRGR